MRQREAINTAIRDIVDSRLAQLGLTKYICSGTSVEPETEKTRAAPPDEKVPSVPIWCSKNVGVTPRVLVLFGESFQDLGVFAQRIIGLHGGINAGSAVDFVKYVKALEIGCDTGTPIPESQTSTVRKQLENPEEIDVMDLTTDYPGIILANTGQLQWCRSMGKALTHVSWDAITRPSAVDEAVRFDPVKNTAPGHRTITEHVESIFTSIIPQLCNKDVKLDVIAIRDSCKFVPLYLDTHWDLVKHRMHTLAMVCPDFAVKDSYHNPEFKNFLLQRTRGFVQDSEMPASSPMFGPNGGAMAWQRAFGYNIYSIPSEMADEMIFPRHYRIVLEWIQRLAERGEEFCENEIAYVTIDKEEAREMGEEKVKSAHEREFLTAETWVTEEGMLEIAKREEDLEAAKKVILAKGGFTEKAEAEERRVKEEFEKYWADGVELKEADLQAKKVGGKVNGGLKESTKAEFPMLEDDKQEDSKWHEKEGWDVRWRWLTKDENDAEDRKRAEIEAELRKKNEMAAAKPQKRAQKKDDSIGDVETVQEDTELPPTTDNAPYICTKSSVEYARKPVIGDLKTLDIATHTALPSTPKPQP